jgi:hypothetical protein
LVRASEQRSSGADKTGGGVATTAADMVGEAAVRAMAEEATRTATAAMADMVERGGGFGGGGDGGDGGL